MAAGLGFQFYDENDVCLEAIGKNLRKIHRIESSQLNLNNTKFTVVSDVMNPLCGPDGASRIYGPQKGAQ